MEHDLRSKQVAFAFEVLTVSNVVKSPTPATIKAGIDGFEATYGLFTVGGVAGTNDVRFRFDGGDPTDTVGHLLQAEQNLEIHGKENLMQLKFIRTSSDATVQCTYAR
jgi:hypothetical protein